MAQRVSNGPWVVFDVGGTSIRAARFDPASGAVTGEVKRTTPSHWTMPGAGAGEIQRRLIGEMKAVSEQVAGGEGPAVLSVAFPGPIDGEGNALSAPTVWGDGGGRPFPVLAELKKAWAGSRVFVMNDVTAAAYRYLRHRDEDFCIVTVSSGIGAKVFVGGRPVLGKSGRGGEIGHARVDFSDDAPVCDCGGKGHLGAIGSGRGALVAARRLAAVSEGFPESVVGRLSGGCAENVDNEMIAKAFCAGDGWALGLIRGVARPLGQMLASIHTATGVERFVIVGGFALALGEGYRRELVRAAGESCWDLGQDWNGMIELGDDDDRSGLIGAGCCALHYQNGGLS